MTDTTIEQVEPSGEPLASALPDGKETVFTDGEIRKRRANSRD